MEQQKSDIVKVETTRETHSNDENEQRRKLVKAIIISVPVIMTLTAQAQLGFAGSEPYGVGVSGV
jgi:hypothetical protein